MLIVYIYIHIYYVDRVSKPASKMKGGFEKVV